MKKLFLAILIIGALVLAYFIFAPSSVDAIAWEPAKKPGYTIDYQKNEKLSGIEYIDLGAYEGPEDLYADSTGNIISGTADGTVIKIDPKNGNITAIGNTGGRPLIALPNGKGGWYIADAILGLLEMDASGQSQVLANEFERTKLNFVDNLCLSKEGVIYFTNASNKFNPKDFNGTLTASTLDLLEHRGNGQIFAYDTQSKSLSLLIPDLVFPNGITLSPDENFLFFTETGEYRVMKYNLKEENSEPTPILENILAFPDNIKTDNDGNYWVGLISPRDALLDFMAPYPGLRNLAGKVPPALLPKSKAYGHILCIDGSGKIIHNLQDPSGENHHLTGAISVGNRLYISNLNSNRLAYIDKNKLN